MDHKTIAKFWLVGTIVLAFGAGIGLFLYNLPQRAVATEAPAFRLTARELVARYNREESQANALYLDQVLEVTGPVGQIITGSSGETTLILREEGEVFGVICTLDGDQPEMVRQVKPGETVKVKGLCTGMLMDVVLVRCVLLE
jgi:hypothetical protein